nr:PREDICTED: colipase [Latimeria chalumnae]|eukprot:XP_006002323.1 PREDICTED: colipase [Latimeria chalumnae]
MKAIALCAVCLFAVVSALPTDKSEKQQRFINLDNGELCLEGIQCKSGCCFRRNGLDLARCASLSAENQECSPNVGAKPFLV